MHPSATPLESEASYAENVQRAQELRRKAQQLAKEELAVLNQAVDLNLLARQLAEATMRPAFVPATTSVPFYISLPAGMGNPAFRMQLMRAQQAALGNQAAQYVNFSSSSPTDIFKPAAAASPAAAGSNHNSPPTTAAGAAVISAPAGSDELAPAAAAGGIEAQQSAAPQSVVRAAGDALLQPKPDSDQQLLHNQEAAAVAPAAEAAEQLESTEQIEAGSDWLRAASETPAGPECPAVVGQAAAIIVDG